MSNPIYGIPPDWKRETIAPLAQRPWTVKEELRQRLIRAGIDGRDCVAIDLDTGFRKHELLPMPEEVRNFTGGSRDDVTDYHGHGTHTIGSILGRDGLSYAPAGRLKVGKVLGNNGSGSNTTDGLKWARDTEGDVVSCSWGGGNSVDSTTDSVCRQIWESNKWLFFAAGNSGFNGRNTVIAPALSQHTGAVASLTESGEPSSFSSGGPRVDVSAGGSQIASCGLNNNIVLMSGTSMATPTFVSVMMLLRQTMLMLGMSVQFTARDFIKWLASEEFLKDAGPAGRDPRYGEGMVNTENILSWIEKKATEFI